MSVGGEGVRRARQALGKVRSAAMRRMVVVVGIGGRGGVVRSVSVRVEMGEGGWVRREVVRVRPRKPLAPVMRMFMVFFCGGLVVVDGIENSRSGLPRSPTSRHSGIMSDEISGTYGTRVSEIGFWRDGIGSADTVTDTKHMR